MKKFISPWLNINSSQNKFWTEKAIDPNVTTFVNLGTTPVVVVVENGLFKNYKNSIDLQPLETQVVYKQISTKGLGKVQVKWQNNGKWKSESSTFNHNYDTIGVSSKEITFGAESCFVDGGTPSGCGSYFIYRRSSKNHIAFGNITVERMRIQNWTGPTTVYS